MRVDNVLNGLRAVGFDEFKGINKDAKEAISNDSHVSETNNVASEIKTHGQEDIASRNVYAKNAQEEITIVQIAQAGLRKQKNALNQTKSDIESGKFTSLSDVNNALKDMKANIDELSDKTTYGGERLFEGNDNSENFQIPSVRLGGKNYLPLNDLKVETQEDLNNALSTIERAITKIDSEIANCGKIIDEKTHQVTETGEFSYVDANYARSLMMSLKSEIYQKGQEAIKSQNVNDIK